MLETLASEASVATVIGASCADVDRTHVENLVSTVFSASGVCTGYELRLHAFMPPYKDVNDAPGGYMEFWFEKELEPSFMFALEFAGKEHERLRFSQLTLASMHEAAIHGDPGEYASVSCFDELWLFACKVANKLEVSKLHISYGI